MGAGRLKTSQAGGSARKVAGGVGLPKLVTEKFGPRYARSMSEVVSKMGKIPAQMDTTSGRWLARGVICGALAESHPDRIVISGCVLFLRPGTACPYAVGMSVEVRYTEIDGRRDVDRIARTRSAT